MLLGVWYCLYMPNETVLSKRLLDCRIAAGLTQVEAAEALGIEQPQLSKWENNHHVPNLETLRHIATVYAVTLSSLLEEPPDEALTAKDVVQLVRDLETPDTPGEGGE